MTDKYGLAMFTRLLASPLVRVGLLLLVLGFCGFGIHAEWPQMRAAIGQLDWYSLVLSAAAAMAGGGCMMLAWRAVLADLGSRLPARTAVRVNFLGQLAKYVPGAVWSVAVMVELGHDNEVPRRRSTTSVAIGLAIILAVGLAVAVVALPLASSGFARHYLWVLAALPVIAVCLYPAILGRLVDRGLRLARMQPLERMPTPRGLARAIGWTALGWLFLGFQVWVVLADVARHAPDSFVLALGAYALAFSAGMLLIVFPGGIGPRELILVATLGAVVPHGAAVVVAVVARAATTVSDLTWGAVALAAGRTGQRLALRGHGRHRRPAAERGPLEPGLAEPGAVPEPAAATPS